VLMLVRTKADMNRRDEVIKVTKERFRIGPPKGMKVHDVIVGLACDDTVWVLEAESEEDLFKWFSPLQPYYTITSIRPAMRMSDLHALFDRELGELVAEVQREAKGEASPGA